MFNLPRLLLHSVAMAGNTGAPLVLRLVAASVSVAEKAGAIVRNVFNSGELGVVEKDGKNDLQTQADRSAQECIVQSLSRQFPKVTIIGEEEPTGETVDESHLETRLSEEVLKAVCPQNLQSVKDEDVVVWVDPLDGTKEYTEGFLDHVTVLIGVAVNGKAVAGVINQPYYNYKAGPGATLGRTMWGIVGLGAFGVERLVPPADKRIVTTTRSHSNKLVTESIEAMQPDEVLRVGGAGHKVLLVIEGKAHAYVFATPGCKKWDTCAPEAILHALGGRLTDIHGNPLQYHREVKHPNTGGVLATYSDHDWYLSRMPESVKAAVKP
ncbi:3'(2'),5'-bisphosphate nucleotidase 1-like [Branchiostoma floridae x Branchiostoma belcheri]